MAKTKIALIGRDLYRISESDFIELDDVSENIGIDENYWKFFEFVQYLRKKYKPIAFVDAIVEMN